jgi:hypothetical protein
MTVDWIVIIMLVEIRHQPADRRLNARKHARKKDMEDEKKTSNQTEKIESQAEKDADTKQQENIENVLASIRPGYSVTVYRVRPSWAKGYLERLDCLEGEPLDLDYLADTWGGEVLRLRLCDKSGTYRGGVDIPFSSYPPRFRGDLLKRNRTDQADLPPEAALATVAPQQVVPQQQQTPIESIFKLLKQTRTEDLATFKTLLASTTTDLPVAQSGITNLVDLAKQMRELQTIFGGAQAQTDQPQDDQMQLMKTLGEVARAVFAKPNNSPPGPPPNQQRVVYQPPKPTNPASPQASQHQVAPASAVPLRETDIAGQLAAMPPDRAADIAMAAMSRMEAGQREEMVGEIMSRLGEESELGSEYDDPNDPDDTDSETATTTDRR